MADNGMIFASDSDTARLQKVRQNVKRMRLNAIEVVEYPEVEKKIQKLKKLDAIVLDVPCSNTGVLARRVEARWRLQKKSMDELLQAQNQLLMNAAALYQHNTRILYSTCSILPEENQHQIQRFLSQHPVFTLEKEKLTLPALKTKKLFDHDGGYAAVLARK
jgi:16S rRNA (cytosine967-C5)-methyltransferase